MSKRIPYEGFCGPTYLASSTVIDSARAINLYPEVESPTSKGRMAMIGRPGLSAFSSVTGSGRSLWPGDGRLFSCTNGHVYEVNITTGATITDFGTGSTGTGGTVISSGTGPSYFVSNGPQLLMADPVIGVIKFVNGTGTKLDDVLSGVALEFLDGYMIAIATGASLVSASNPNQLSVSNFLSADTAAAWASTNYVLRTGASDRIIQLAALNGLLYVFGRKTMEAWYNAGNPLFPFARVSNSVINVGCLAAASVVKFLNGVMWLGGNAKVYRIKGLAPEVVSNPAIESIISQYAGTGGPYAKAFGYEEAGHSFYCLNMCNSSYVTQYQIVYDLTTGLWHERTYTGYMPTAAAFAEGTAHPFIMDETGGRIYQQGLTYTSDAGTGIYYERTAPVVCELDQRIRHHRFEVSGDFGTASPTLDWSDDGGRTFGGRTLALRQAADDAGGGTVSPSFRRFFATELGSSRSRNYKLKFTDSSNQIRIAEAYLEVS